MSLRDNFNTARMSSLARENESLKHQLAITQADNFRLREALDIANTYIDNSFEGECNWPFNPLFKIKTKDELVEYCNKTISTPPNTAELEAHVEIEIERRFGKTVYVSYYSEELEQVDGGCTIPVTLRKANQ